MSVESVEVKPRSPINRFILQNNWIYRIIHCKNQTPIFIITSFHIIPVQVFHLDLTTQNSPNAAEYLGRVNSRDDWKFGSLNGFAGEDVNCATKSRTPLCQLFQTCFCWELDIRTFYSDSIPILFLPKYRHWLSDYRVLDATWPLYQLVNLPAKKN